MWVLARAASYFNRIREGPVAEPPAVKTSPEMVARGKDPYSKARCGACHGGAAGLLPSLLTLAPEKHEIFKQIVLGGALEGNGMASFSDLLSEPDVEDIHAYIVDAARKRLERVRGR